MKLLSSSKQSRRKIQFFKAVGQRKVEEKLSPRFKQENIYRELRSLTSDLFMIRSSTESHALIKLNCQILQKLHQVLLRLWNNESKAEVFCSAATKGPRDWEVLIETESSRLSIWKILWIFIELVLQKRTGEKWHPSLWYIFCIRPLVRRYKGESYTGSQNGYHRLHESLTTPNTILWNFGTTQHVLCNFSRPHNMSKTISGKISIYRVQHPGKEHEIWKRVSWEIDRESHLLQHEYNTERDLYIKTFHLNCIQLRKTAREFSNRRMEIWIKDPVAEILYKIMTKLPWTWLVFKISRTFKTGLQHKTYGSPALALRTWINTGRPPQKHSKYIYLYLVPIKDVPY